MNYEVSWETCYLRQIRTAVFSGEGLMRLLKLERDGFIDIHIIIIKTDKEVD